MKTLKTKAALMILIGIIATVSCTKDDPDTTKDKEDVTQNEDDNIYKITFEDVSDEYLAGPSAYGENLYSTYSGENPSRYTGYTDEKTGLFFYISNDYYSGGIAISDWNDKETEGFTNQCSVYYGDSGMKNGGNGNSSKFAVGFFTTFGENCWMQFENDAEYKIKEIYINNSTYATISMQKGDGFAQAHSYELQSWLKVIMTGYDKDGNETGKAECMLSDFRKENSPGIITDWQCVNLEGLGTVNKIVFTMDGSDKMGEWLNTPAYFCMDDISIYTE